MALTKKQVIVGAVAAGVLAVGGIAYAALNSGACHYADAVAVGDGKADKKLIESLKEESGTKLLPFHKHHEEEVEGFVEFYEKLVGAD